MSGEPSQEFNQTKWLAAKSERFSMGDDIVTSKLLLDKDSIQVKELLGEPNMKNSTTNSWIYDMGTGGGGLGFLIHHLSVTFEKNKVAKVDHHSVKD